MINTLTKQFLRAGSLLFVLASLATAAPIPVESVQKDADGLTLKMRPGMMKVQVWQEQVFRVVYSPTDSLPTSSSLAVIAKPEMVAWKLQENDEELVVATKAMQARISRKTGAVSFFNADGQPILQESADGGKTLSPANIAGLNTLNLQQSFQLASDEAIYGLGQHQQGLMNCRGHKVLLQQKNMEVAVPVLLSTRGYGVLWDNPAIASVTIGTPEAKDQVVWNSEAGSAIDYYVMYGPELDDVIAGYRRLTGPAPMFSKWTWGYWQCKEHYHTQAELLGVLSEYRRRQIPLDGIIQDWFYWQPAPWGSHNFDPNRYPDPTAMVSEVHKQNAHIIISVWAKFVEGSANYDDLNTAGLLYPPFPYEQDQAKKCSYYDAFSPKGREMYWAQMNKQLFSRGFDGWWLDATEPELSVNWGEFRNHSTAAGPGALVHNAFPLKTTQAVHDGQRAVTSDKRVFILTRSAYAGQQRNAAVTWSGDIGSDWGTFKRQIPAGLNFVSTGIPYWNTDIGGFNSRPNTDPDYRECFTRWFQYGSFCPMFRVHGTGANKSMWDFGPDVEKILIKYNHLRYRLMPYIYSLAWKVTNEHYTMMRPLAMDFRTDPKVQNIPDQFLFGPAIMACPVTEPSSGEVPIVIPGANLADKDGKVGGLSATYFQGHDLVDKKHERRDEFIAFTWDKVKREGVGENFQHDPVPGLVMDHFSARWEGFLLTKDAGEYVLQLKGDDGIRLWIDNKLAIEDWASRPCVTKTAKVQLPANTRIPIRIEYYQNTDDANIELSWQWPHKKKEIYTRKVYLPKGIWRDFWTGQEIAGGQEIQTPAPLDTMPIFIRAGSIVPMGPVMQHVTEKPTDPIELRIYRGADGSFALYEDEGDNYHYEKGVHATIPFSWNEARQKLTIGQRQGQFPGMLQNRTFRVVFVTPGNGVGIEEAKEVQVVQYTGKTVEINP